MELDKKRNPLGTAVLVWTSGASLVAAIDYSNGQVLSSILIWAVLGFGAFIALMMPIYELGWGDGWHYTLIIWGPGLVWVIIVNFFYFGNWTEAEDNEDNEIPEGEGLERGSTARKSTPRRTPKSTTARSPTTESRYVPIATGADWDNYYEKLIDLHGCGPGTAQRIMSKVLADQDLTDHENNFWHQVQ